MSLGCNDIGMAKEYANKPSDQKVKKKLWKMIAKYLFSYQSKKVQAKAGAKPGISSSGVGVQQKPVHIDVTAFLTSAACIGAVETQSGTCWARSSPCRPLFLFLASSVRSV